MTEYKEGSGFFYLPFTNLYAISKNGRVICVKTEKDVKQRIDKASGNLRLVLKLDEKQMSYFVSRLVAKTFIPKDEASDERDFVAYKDGNSLNLKVDNLYWTNTSKMQNEVWETKRKADLEKYPLPKFDKNNTGLFPNAVKCKEKEGYYYIPFTTSHVVVNKQGHLFDLIEDEDHAIRLSVKGYVLTTLRQNDGYFTIPVHRLVAFLFNEKPERHKLLDFKDLQVNHIDGIKEHNNTENLEWVTNDENMKHARRTGLFSNEKAVLAKNVLTQVITRYISVSECSRQHLISSSALSSHLHSFMVSKIIENGHVFKFDDDTPWSDFISPERDDLGISNICDVVGVNIDSEEIMIFTSLRAASRLLGYPSTTIQMHISRKGRDAPFKGWLFHRSSDYFNKLK